MTQGRQNGDQSMKNGASRTKAAGGIVFSDAEERAVESINAEMRVVNGARLAIGKTVDALVQERGDESRYGEDTLGRLARHPRLGCCEENLRRYWHYYLLFKEYGNELRQVAPSLSYSHHYQLSRILDTEDEDSQRATIVAMAKKAVDEGLTATELQQAISSHLDTMGKLTRGGKKGREADCVTTREPEADAYDALIEMSETVVKSMASIPTQPDLKRIGALKCAANQLAFAYIQLVKALVGTGDADAMEDAKRVGESLAAAIADGKIDGGTDNVNA
jgi:hypothetical protein